MSNPPPLKRMARARSLGNATPPPSDPADATAASAPRERVGPHSLRHPPSAPACMVVRAACVCFASVNALCSSGSCQNKFTQPQLPRPPAHPLPPTRALQHQGNAVVCLIPVLWWAVLRCTAQGRPPKATAFVWRGSYRVEKTRRSRARTRTAAAAIHASLTSACGRMLLDARCAAALLV